MKWVVSKFSGEKISPIEVDAVLLSHPDVAQAVAFGVPDDKYGEEVHDQLQLSLSLLPKICDDQLQLLDLKPFLHNNANLGFCCLDKLRHNSKRRV